MRYRNAVMMVVTLGAVMALLACVAMRSGYVPPLQHPQDEGENYGTCTDCHEEGDLEIPIQRFVHTLSFGANHKQAAYQNPDVCYMCHRQSYCNDCHGVWVELKPSIKNQTENARWMPHRGDYISRHAIDARINPAPCFRCHGNPKTARTCVPCHG